VPGWFALLTAAEFFFKLEHIAYQHVVHDILEHVAATV
jgi:hypothetical protein